MNEECVRNVECLRDEEREVYKGLGVLSVRRMRTGQCVRVEA